MNRTVQQDCAFCFSLLSIALILLSRVPGKKRFQRKNKREERCQASSYSTPKSTGLIVRNQEPHSEKALRKWYGANTRKATLFSYNRHSCFHRLE